MYIHIPHGITLSSERATPSHHMQFKADAGQRASDEGPGEYDRAYWGGY